MLSVLSLTNFRAFSDAHIALAPLTVVVGQNSAGKSSIVSALLLLKQTLEDPAYGVRIPVLRLSGSQLDAGTYRDVVHNHNVARAIHFSFEFVQGSPRLGPPLAELDVPRFFSANLRVFRQHRIYAYGYDDEKVPRPKSISLEYKPSGEFGPALAKFDVEARGGQRIWFTRTRERERIQHWRSYTNGLPRQAFLLEPSEYSPLFPDIRLRPGLKRLGSKDRRSVSTMMRQVHSGFADIRMALSLLSYIGPFRTPPKRRYAFSGIGATEVGRSGEQTTDLLVLEGLTRAQGPKPLTQGVAFWLRRLGLARALQVTSLAPGSNLFEVRLERAGTAKLANIADVGFGLSQVLPVIAAGLLVPRGGLFVVQQPELHLHPDAQAGLADFFLYLAGQGIRCIVETHSEYFLVRLRRRLAEGGLPRPLTADANRSLVGMSKHRDSERALAPWRPLKRGDVNIILVELSQSKSTMKALPINSLFQLENLPPDFMSQALQDRLAIAQALRGRE